MEHEPHNHNHDVPEDERLWPGEIDLTGAVEQEDALIDVIGDAIGEAQESGGEVPEWGARTLARALANQLNDPHSGALHRFAITGHIDRDALGQELAGIYEGTTDEEIKEWVNWLGTYIVNLPSSEDTDEQRLKDPPEVPIGGTPLEKVSAYLQIAFAEADARGEAVDAEDAQVIATLLTPLLNPDSEMARFATTGDANPAVLHEECRRLAAGSWQTTGVHLWVTRLEQHLASRTDLGRGHDAQPPNHERE